MPDYLQNIFWQWLSCKKAWVRGLTACDCQYESVLRKGSDVSPLFVGVLLVRSKLTTVPLNHNCDYLSKRGEVCRISVGALLLLHVFAFSRFFVVVARDKMTCQKNNSNNNNKNSKWRDAFALM